MASKETRTWIWIIVGFVGVCVLGIVALAGVGFYFVSQRVDAKKSTPVEAFASLDDVLKSLPDATPLYKLGEDGEPELTVALGTLPTSPTKATDLWIHVWDPDDGRLVKLALPFWMLKLGDKKIRVASHEGGFNIDEFDFDVPEFERIGPRLIVDYRGEDGERILVWTR